MQKIILIFISLFLCSCVSLDISEDKLTDTKNISYYDFYNKNLRLRISVKNNKTTFFLTTESHNYDNFIGLNSIEIYEAETFDKEKRLKMKIVNTSQSVEENSYTYQYTEKYSYTYDNKSYKEIGYTTLSTKEVEKLYKILKESKKVNIRYYGNKYYIDKILKKTAKDGIIKTIEYYYENIAQ